MGLKNHVNAFNEMISENFNITGLNDEILIHIISKITNMNDLINFMNSNNQFKIIFKNYTKYILNKIIINGKFSNFDISNNIFSELFQFNWFNNCQINGLIIEPFMKLSVLNNNSYNNNNNKFDKFIYLNIFGEVKLIITEYEYTQLVKNELNNFIKHTQGGDNNNNSSIIYPEIPKIPNKLKLNKDYLIDSNGTIFYILTFKHSKPHGKFINLINEKSYFMILDNDLNIWCNPYDKLLSPIVCLDYNFQNSELSIRDDDDNNNNNNNSTDDIIEDTDSISPIDLKISINSKYDYCKLMNQQYFIVFKNGLRIHHETYEPYIMNKTDMRPCVISTSELFDNHSILDFELIYDYLVFVSTTCNSNSVSTKNQNQLILNYLRFDTEFSYELKSIVYEFKINEFKSQIILNEEEEMEEQENVYQFKDIISVSNEFFMIHINNKLYLYKIIHNNNFQIKNEIKLIKKIKIPINLSNLIFKIKSNYESNNNLIKINLILHNGELIKFKILINNNKFNESIEDLITSNNKNIIDYNNGITVCQIVN